MSQQFNDSKSNPGTVETECTKYINPDTDGRPFTLFPMSMFLPAMYLVTRDMEHPDM